MKKKFPVLIGAVAGLLNGLFGSGGGTAAVPLYKKSGLSVTEAHATSVFVMFFLSAVSAGIYFYEGHLDFADALGFLPGGIIGAVVSSSLFKKANPAVIKKVFGGFVTFSAARMLWGVISQWI